ncbi:hypothetical protein PT285_05335 [Lactobacillus sp. ESL0791]|uniref:hypothetical protein n=1 Tax=Lactobacillus sp. ESL0791 TaxID=2983234 RepID=UPI0023F7BF08|nr:hypothetical protein [Lactobacillus sp. ESL0791]MDF7638819.1 hypothetical protein [Lactobacillus sp. ESL0791]
MTEKRSEYRKEHRKKKKQGLFQDIKSAFIADDDDVDVNSDFQRQPEEKDDGSGNDQVEHFRENASKENITDNEQTVNDKSLRLKKKLNHAIIIVFLLILLVLFALFRL